MFCILVSIYIQDICIRSTPPQTAQVAYMLAALLDHCLHALFCSLRHIVMLACACMHLSSALTRHACICTTTSICVRSHVELHVPIADLQLKVCCIVPLQGAAEEGHIGCVALMLRSALKKNDLANALLAAAKHGHEHIVHLLVAAGQAQT